MEKTEGKDKEPFHCFESLIESHVGFAETLPDWITDNAPESQELVFSPDYFVLVEKHTFYASKKHEAFSQMPPTFFEFAQQQKEYPQLLAIVTNLYPVL